MLYVGYPITYETACYIFHRPFSNNIESYINEHGLNLVRVDKGLFVLGLQVTEVSDLWNNFISVDNSLIKIIEAKTKVVELIKKAEGDLSDFSIQHMEGDKERVYNPQPYLISF
jgi:hypothetical protein